MASSYKANTYNLSLLSSGLFTYFDITDADFINLLAITLYYRGHDKLHSVK